MARRLIHRPSWILLGASMLLIFGAATAVAAGPTPDPQLLSLFKTPNTQFPAVAMRIDGQPVSGQYLAYAVKQYEDNAASAGRTVTRAQAVEAVVDHLTTAAAIAHEAARHGYSVSEQEVTTYLTTQTNAAVAAFPAQAAAVWAANGDTDGSAYINDPRVRELAARMIAGGKMLAAMRASDPNFDAHAFAEQLKSSIPVELYFTP